MELVFQVVLSNAIAAMAVAVVAFGFSRLFARPQVVHWLWVLVLVKLVTPPVMLVPFSRPEAPSSLAVVKPRPPRIERPRTSGHMKFGHTLIGPPAPRAQPPPPPPALTAGSGRTQVQLPRRIDLLVLIPWLGVAGLLWCGTCLRIRQFGRLLRHCAPAGSELQHRTLELAARLGMRRAPAVWMSPAPISPLLWAVGSRPRLVVPEALWNQLDGDQRDALLLHELAHWKRRDHWVRFLEIAAVGVYWWHPVVWWARRALREAEEHCCDDLVVSALSGRAKSYAYALLDTLDFLAETPLNQPLGASGLIEESQLKRRLVRILGGTARGRLTWATGLCLAGLTAGSLWAGPLLAPAQRRYRVLDLGTLGGLSTQGVWLNSQGQVLGRSATSFSDGYGHNGMHAFRTAPDRPIDPTTDDLTLMVAARDPRSKVVLPGGINASGQIALRSERVMGLGADGRLHPNEGPIYIFRFDSDRLVDLALDPDLEQPYATAINDLGQIVGHYGRRVPAPGFPRAGWDIKFHSYRTRPGQTPDVVQDDLGSLGGHFTYACDINNAGQVVGDASDKEGLFHPFRTAPNRPIDPATDQLDILVGGGSNAKAINDLGEVVGSVRFPGQHGGQAFRTAPNRPIDPATDYLGTLGGEFSGADAINNRGDVVGSATTALGTSHAFLFTAGRMIDLNRHVDLSERWVLESAVDINDRGQILAIASVDWPLIDYRITRTFLLTPVVDPTPIFVLLSGTAVTALGLAVARARRSRGPQWKNKFPALFALNRSHKEKPLE